MDSNFYSILLISNDANYGNLEEIYVYTNLIILLAALQKIFMLDNARNKIFING